MFEAIPCHSSFGLQIRPVCLSESSMANVTLMMMMMEQRVDLISSSQHNLIPIQPVCLLESSMVNVIFMMMMMMMEKRADLISSSQVPIHAFQSRLCKLFL